MSAFRLDRTNAKLMGVCAGLAAAFNADPLLVRLGVLALALLIGPIIVLAYLLTAWAAA